MKKFICTVLLLFFAVNPLLSQSAGFSFKLSTLGFGTEAIVGINDNFNVRAGGNYFFYNLKGKGGPDDDFSYDAKTRLMTFSSQFDWFPFSNEFRLSGAVFYNFNKGDISMNPLKSYTISGRTYTPAELGSMKGTITFPEVAPYFGIGIGNPMTSEDVSFSLDLGAIYQNTPQVDLEATGLLAPSASQEDKIESNLSWFKFYPVLTLALNYKF